jgi:hypothetical protein
MTLREHAGNVKVFCTGFVSTITNQFTKCLSARKGIARSSPDFKKDLNIVPLKAGGLALRVTQR